MTVESAEYRFMFWLGVGMIVAGLATLVGIGPTPVGLNSLSASLIGIIPFATALKMVNVD